ncbi:hypothetical protein N9L68_05895 [bacterium]|nr:hypothetical protein [bacterium]
MEPSWRARALERWDDSTATALTARQACLPESAGQVAQHLLDHGAVTASTRAAQLAGRLPAGCPAGFDDLAGRTAEALLAPAGMGGPEHSESAPQPELQAQLCDLVARILPAEFEGLLRRRQDWSGLRLLADLRDPGTSHTWLWELANDRADVLLPGDFGTAFRLGLGADVYEQGGRCAWCGKPLGREGRRALRCAPGEATRGNKWVRDTILCLASLADGAAATEASGLVPSAPRLRPADFLTTAAFGRLVALDVGVACPDADGQAVTRAQPWPSGNLIPTSRIWRSWTSMGVAYRSLVWSSWGRSHADADSAVASVAAAAAQRLGAARPAALLARAQTATGVQLWHRAARMVAACSPDLPTEDLDLLFPAAIQAAQEREGRSSSAGGCRCSSRPSSRSSSFRASAAPPSSPVPATTPLPGPKPSSSAGWWRARRGDDRGGWRARRRGAR